MSRTIKLVGLDCGSTTSCVVVATAQLTSGTLGRVEISRLHETFRSPLVLTPFSGNKIDVPKLAEYLDRWLTEAGAQPAEIFGGGALITGLAAQRENAAAVARQIESRLAEALIVAADEPRFESWLAFMGNCHALSLTNRDLPILNIDIGGGTTNLALGCDGQVLATGSLHVGARHFQFTPGTLELTGLSPQGESLLADLKIQRCPGDTFTSGEVDVIIGHYVRVIEAAIAGDAKLLASPMYQSQIQTPLVFPELDRARLAITLSGGVGELAYKLREGQQPTMRTEFGDLGQELAQGLLASKLIAPRLTLIPEGGGRATVFGLLRHSTELSGATLFLPQPERLPLRNVPILGTIITATSANQVAELAALASPGAPAVAWRIALTQHDLAAVRQLATAITDGLTLHPLHRDTLLVLLVSANLGKTLGNLITRWGTLKLDLMVIDEVPVGDAQFVRLGRLCDGVVPLWLHSTR